MQKRAKKILGCALGAVGVTAVAAALFILFGVSALTGAYFNNPWDRAKLRAMCDPLKNVPTLIEAHRAKHGEYPRSIEGIDPSLPGAAVAKKAFTSASGFRYRPNELGYQLHKNLNWDGGIMYSDRAPKWMYFINDDVEWPIY